MSKNKREKLEVVRANQRRASCFRGISMYPPLGLGTEIGKAVYDCKILELRIR